MVTNIPGSSIIFEQAKGLVAPTKGRAFDRIGLEAFEVFQDPFGTLIEMSEGLSAVK